MSGTVDERRTELVAALVCETRKLLDTYALDRHVIEIVKGSLSTLAAETYLWSDVDFPDPREAELQARYRVGGEDGNGLSLYLNVMRPGNRISPHDHTVWACIAAVDGIEYNTKYHRLDDGSRPGRARIIKGDTIALGPGSALALMPDDIHSVEIAGNRPTRHLHFYARPLESLTGRKSFDVDAGTYGVMDIGVKTTH